MSKNWESLATDEQRTLLKTLPSADLAKTFQRDKVFFDQVRTFFHDIPANSKEGEKEHYPPKALILNARRDLSFFEANFELIDNSIDEWRKNNIKKDLHIRIKYDLDVLVGEYEDNAGGMEESDVYKVFIPGESTNDDYTKPLIGSFGMGAKKAIFRLSDGAKVVSCKTPKHSSTSEVPEKWDSMPSWRTVDGRCEPIGVGVTRFYFLKLLMPPTLADLEELNERIKLTYAPLFRHGDKGRKIRVTINDTPVDPPKEIVFSAASGVEPRIYTFSHEFKNLLRTGKDVTLNFRFKCGLLTQLPGQDPDREDDWGIDVYANGRLIQSNLKTEFGFGTSGMGMQNQGSKFFRGELFISGHSFGIPWDTHKREYFSDHEVSHWIKNALRPIIKKYVTLAGRFSGETELRKKELTKPFSGKPKEHPVDTETLSELPDSFGPKWKFKGQGGGASKKGKQDSASKSNANNGDDNPPHAVAVQLTKSDLASLLTRFGSKGEDELSRVIYNCLSSGVVFPLERVQLTAALTLFGVDDPGELSEKVKAQLVRALKTKK